MAVRYQIRVKDVAGLVVAIMTDWERLDYTKRVNGVDNYSLTFDGESANADLFDLDGQVEVWRSDLAASPAIALYLEFEAFHRTEVRQTLDDGHSLFGSHGAGYDHLLDRRHILYPAASAQATKAAVGETAMKAFVDENAGPSATFPPRLLASGVFTGLTIQADGAAGSSWTGGRAYRNLLDVLVEIADASAVDFGIVGTGAATFEFQAQASPWGADRTTVGLDPATGLNGAGNAPVIFTLERGNMKSPLYSLNRRKEANAAIALGQGQRADREVIQRTDAVAIAASTWNRIESTRQANTEALTAGLNAVGDQLLAELQAKEVFNFDAMQVISTRYGRDYFLGDLVTARYKAIEANKKIVGVNVTVVDGRESITLELSDVPLR